jgi:hypothetical protein
VPGAEVFGGELTAGHLPQVVVDVACGDVVPSRAAAVDEQVVTPGTAPLEAAHHAAHLLVDDGLLAVLAALAGVLEGELALAAGHVLTADRRQAERAVLGGVLLSARAEEVKVDQPHRGGQHPVPAQPRPLQMALDHRPDPWQRAAELHHPVEFLPVPALPPQLVVQVLAAASRIGAQRLDVAARLRADPHIFPGRRDHQRFDAGERRRVGERRAVRGEVAEAGPAPAAPESRTGRIGLQQGNTTFGVRQHRVSRHLVGHRPGIRQRGMSGHRFSQHRVGRAARRAPGS